jgi:hypothetical protein
MSKVIYLDQNKWIDLARAFYGREDGEKYKDILDIITTKVANNEIILPMSVVHFIETARSVNPDRAERLAKFMLSLSKKFGILPFNSIRENEVQQAILRKLGYTPKINIKDLVINRNIFYAVGGELKIEGLPNELEKELYTLIEDETILIKLLINAYMHQLSLDLKKEDEEVLEELEESRRKLNSELSTEMRLRLSIEDMAKGSLSRLTVNFLNNIGYDVKVFVDQFKTVEDWKDFFLGIPTMDIWINLNLNRDNDMNRKIHRNDLNDIAFLSIAVPYCDIVVTENYWANILNTKKYDNKYNCIVLTDVNDIQNYI